MQHLIKTLGIFFLAALLFSCADISEKQQTIQGYAQGTTYSIHYFGQKSKLSLQKEIDKSLLDLDWALSNYRVGSQISKLNQSQEQEFLLTDTNGFWKQVWEVSSNIYKKTNGAFDPSIYPLVKAYGFGPGQKPSLQANQNLDSLKLLVGLDQWKFDFLEEQRIKISKPNGGQLDFNAVAQGMAVDILANVLEKHLIQSYFIELGGEVKVGNKKPNLQPWVLGIETPINETERSISDTLQISNISVATSGSNRKFYEENGKRFSHNINPKTGIPVSHSVLSVTVKHPSCAYADAWATAALVLGKDAIPLLKKEKIWYQFQ